MKIIKTFIAIGFTTLLMSCGPAKETTSKTVNENRGRSNVEATANANKTVAETSRTVRKNPTVNEMERRISKIEEEKYLELMYSDLDMSLEQQAQFQKEWKKTMDSWRRSNRDKVMNNYERAEHEDRILRDILNDDQLENYHNWVRKNANRN